MSTTTRRLTGAPVVESLEIRRLLSGTASAALIAASDTPARQMECLDRGVVALNKGGGNVYVGWRLLGTDSANVAFNLYRSTNGGAAVKRNATPISATTNFTDTGVATGSTNSYFVRPVINGVEQPPSESFSLAANAPVRLFLSVPLQIPPGGITPDNVAYTYSANDVSVGDLNGDGDYEYIVKWDPSNSKDNSQSGYTGNVYIDAYELDGTRLWRIDLGINIRAGAHYTQFMVYDLDGDGRAEVALRTAPGTKDGPGNNVILPGHDAAADYRNSSGYVLSGPEYLTIFNGQTGAAMATTNFLVGRGSVSSWGDSYGNRVDRFLAGVAYLDGQRPSLVMGRGYYERTTVSAWNWRDGKLTQAWAQPFDSEDATPDPAYEEMGAHSLSIADVDLDGRDEIIYGAMALDDDGTGLYSSGFGHGDALHLSDMDPSRPGLEVFQVHENVNLHQGNGGTLRDAATGALLLGIPGGTDVGRGVAFDIDPRPGYEMWTSANGNIYNVDGTIVAAKPSNMHQNFGVWWDADPYRETLDGTTIGDWNFTTDGRVNYDLDPATSGSQSAPGVSSNNGTKSNPALSADLFGDWREEVIWRTTDSSALRIFTTAIPSAMRLFTLMHDAQYRVAIAWQNVAYNQPPHPSFFLGNGMVMPAMPNIYTPGPGGTVSGVVFHDTDADNLFDAAEPTLSGVTVFLDADNDSALDAGEPSTTSNAGGAYAFVDVTPGEYVARAIAPTSYVSTNSVPVTVSSGSASIADLATARTVYDGTSGADDYLVRRNALGQYEILIGGALAYTVFPGVPSLTFNLQGGNDALTVDAVNGVPAPGSGLAFNGGNDDDLLTVRGSVGHDLVNFASSSVAINGKFILPGAVERSSFDGMGGGDELTVGAGVVSLVSTQTLNSLTINAPGVLDLLNQDLVIDYSSVSPVGVWTGDAYDGISGYVRSGRLISSLATAGRTALAVAEARDTSGISGSQTGTWGGQAVDSTSVLVKFTWAGDATLDGRINVDDYGRIDGNVSSSGSVWGYFNGDFNYDGKINVDDYGIIDANVNSQDQVL